MSPDTGLIGNELNPLVTTGLLMVLVMLACCGVLFTLFRDTLSGRRNTLNRLSIAAGVKAQTDAGSEGVSEQRRKQSIEKALNELAKRERSDRRARMTLKMRLDQAGLHWNVANFYALCLGVFMATLAGLVLLAGAGWTLSVLLALVIGFAGPNLYIRRQFNLRMKRFVDEFPNALDIVTRGIKTGLPLSDCLRAIATETQEPVNSEFQKILDDLTVGLTVSQSLDRLTHRVPILETKFFSIVIALQSQMGGNLSEALGNLSRVLRERKMMKEKIKAFSSEATASGTIIAAMPVAVSGILSLTSPDYIGLMFSEPMGNIVLGICAIWMSIGVTVMRNMIRFDF